MKFILNWIPDKPIYFEMRTQVRRASAGAFKGNQVATLIVVLIVFSMVAYSFFSTAKYIPIGITMFFLPAMAALAVPGVLNSVVSGEIQKRSLEPLLASPLSPFEIIKAKALRAVVPVALCLAMAFALILLLAIGKAFMGDEPETNMFPAVVTVVAGVIIYAALSYCLVGITLAVSSVTRSAVASLLTTYGVLVGIFIIVPAIVAPVVAAISSDSLVYLAAMHPYGMLVIATYTDASTNASMLAVVLIAIATLVAYVIVGFMTMAFAANRLEKFKKVGTGV